MMRKDEKKSNDDAYSRINNIKLKIEQGKRIRLSDLVLYTVSRIEKQTFNAKDIAEAIAIQDNIEHSGNNKPSSMGV